MTNRAQRRAVARAQREGVQAAIASLGPGLSDEEFEVTESSFGFEHKMKTADGRTIVRRGIWPRVTAALMGLSALTGVAFGYGVLR